MVAETGYVAAALVIGIAVEWAVGDWLREKVRVLGKT
jgi:hypothetical protein